MIAMLSKSLRGLGGGAGGFLTSELLLNLPNWMVPLRLEALSAGMPSSPLSRIISFILIG